MKILFIGDIFGKPGLQSLIHELSKLKKKYRIDFVIAQGENVSGRKGLIYNDYLELKKAGVNAFTMGNHVWSKDEIKQLFINEDIIRPLNVSDKYPGKGSIEFKVNNNTLRITSMLGITFNKLRKPWKESFASNFFDSFDKLYKKNKSDYHIIDFHGETTSEKAVFSLYADGKVNAIIGTHTHVQTADERTLPKGTAFISDAGMTGPANSAIGADFYSVYKKMRFNEMSMFKVSKNICQINGVVITLEKNQNTIERINYLL